MECSQTALPMQNVHQSTRLFAHCINRPSRDSRLIFFFPTRSDLLLLDEPTNHLSIAAVLSLAKELATSKTWQTRTVVVVSHDRHFVDDATTDPPDAVCPARRLPQHWLCSRA